MHYIFFTLFTFFISTNVCHAIEFNSVDTTNKEYAWIITESNLHDFKLKSIKNTKYKKHKLEELFEKIITDLENTGYPFAKIDFKTDSINDYKIYGKIYLDKKKKTLIDSIAIKGYNSFPNYLINRHVDIKNNSTYNQKKINNISNKIQSINFIKEYKENEILFNNNKNIIYIYLNKENNNYIDAFIGFNNFNEDLSILGKIHFVIKNSINRFEKIELKWSKSENNSQELNLNIEFPYIFNSIIGIKNKIRIFQYENLFNKRELNFAISFDNKINLEYINRISAAFEDNPINLINNFKSNQINVFWNKKNTKLKEINLSIGLGKSLISKETYNRKYGSLYFELLKQTFKSNYISLKSINEFTLGNNILDNERKAIGGNNYLRGFLDNYFFSKSFNIINIENIYYINNQTYFSIFSDFGVLYDNEEQIIYSIGIGTGILKNNDIFSVNYAIPNQNNKFDFNDAKLHFNYIIKF